MPSPAVVRKLAGEVGDQIAIGSALVVIETEGADTAAAPPKRKKCRLPTAPPVPTQAQEEANPTLEVADEPAPSQAAPAPPPKPEPAPAAPGRGKLTRHRSLLLRPSAPARAISGSTLVR